MTNILILSCGTRNKIVKYFKNCIGKSGTVVATDCSYMAPALYEADKYYIVPKITDPQYIQKILDICYKENIKGVLSLIDPELSLLEVNRGHFEALDVKIIGSPLNLCEMALDKWKMFLWCKEHHYKCAASYIDLEKFISDERQGKITYPVFVKPVRGSASVSISRIDNEQMLREVFKQNKGLMIQEYLNGQEIGADCYIDLISGKLVSIFLKKKIVMRAGETDKAVSFKDEKLFELIKKFVKESGYQGQIDIDIFDVNGEYYISEVNPRFGGGYPHAYECGVDHMNLIVRNLKGIENKCQIGDYQENLVMMKYSEIKVLKLGEKNEKECVVD
ncbi:ATP-grasp domain-containing protein [Anaerostipes sp.]|uniref:ATP-grasp domain-containing protein n=1 Tax=Anaerostipes sp. TaxID=1872530 RepID=UPI0025B88A98|nr:ATP-grasp domain-containing protein [Anaerostipes sp.]MBS7007114.1 ATP-grasp domain-containing protein [Anaerostipes sp.]